MTCSGCALFVKLPHEKTPASWKPAESQLLADVAQLDFVEDRDTIPSKAYFCFPSDFGDDDTPMDAWDSRQYLAHLRTAAGVLVGPPRCGGSIHHSVLKLRKVDDTGSWSDSVRTYGFSGIRQSDLRAIQPWRNAAEAKANGEWAKDSRGNDVARMPEVQLLRQTLPDKNVYFVIPGFYPDMTPDFANFVPEVHLLRPTSVQFPAALSRMRAIVDNFLGNEVHGVTHIRLLSGRRTIGDDIDSNQGTLLLPMKGTVSADHIAKCLTELVRDDARFIVLHPIYQDEETTLHAGWAKGTSSRESTLPLPPLGSTVAEFREQVYELCQLLVGERVLYNPDADDVSISPYLLNGLELPTYIVGPKTTDDEWFSIRAQMPTRNANVHIWPASKWDWQKRMARSNIWGPRYGPAARYSGNSDVDEKNLALQRPTQVDSYRLSESTDVIDSDLMAKQRKPRQSRHESDNAGSQVYSIFEDHRSVSPVEYEPKGSAVTAAIVPDIGLNEVAREKRLTRKLRSMLLQRIVRCPYPQCDFTIRGEENHAFESHVYKWHLARKCIWCDEPVFEWWDDERKDRHLREKHRERLMGSLGVTSGVITQRDGEEIVTIPLKQLPSIVYWSSSLPGPPADTNPYDDDETRHATSLHPLYGPGQRFCDRCGRDRRHFATKAEELYHDRNCVPGVLNGARCNFCKDCGAYRWYTHEDILRSGRCPNGAYEPCSHLSDPQGPGEFCVRCGIDFRPLSPSVRLLHEESCRGYDSQPGRFCPHCGVNFWEGHAVADWHYNTRHIETCAAMGDEETAIEPRNDGDSEGQTNKQSKANKDDASRKPKKRKRFTGNEDDNTADSHCGPEDALETMRDQPTLSRVEQGGAKRRRDDADTSYSGDISSDSSDSLAPNEVETGRPAKRQRRRRTKDDDGLYQYSSDEDSADGLLPDEDDLRREESAGDEETADQAESQIFTEAGETERPKKAFVVSSGELDGEYRYASDGYGRRKRRKIFVQSKAMATAKDAASLPKQGANQTTNRTTEHRRNELVDEAAATHERPVPLEVPVAQEPARSPTSSSDHANGSPLDQNDASEAASRPPAPPPASPPDPSRTSTKQVKKPTNKKAAGKRRKKATAKAVPKPKPLPKPAKAAVRRKATVKKEATPDGTPTLSSIPLADHIVATEANTQKDGRPLRRSTRTRIRTQKTRA
ncbi:hypothetical protein DCS_06355 [Drechmeria coniospora]|uniref:Uncharacterized protein n=1 Tax=Drechmeria coniospora TaxID=98403 RepID=A0A151GBB6_DRECN|nr:hypothetical protein DCS_06355 [Drechmeria coniospora]KYK54397.1 hypothetical protein DCS_06355 [Drechmeria coniospora]